MRLISAHATAHDLAKIAIFAALNIADELSDTREHYEQWVRAVVDIPYDPMLAPGLHLDPLKISKKTHDACMEMAAVVVDGL